MDLAIKQYHCGNSCVAHLSNIIRHLQAPVEKASIDEVYIDVTSMVEAELKSMAGGNAAPGAAGTGDAADDAGGTAGFGKF